jgi:hypothetical protein
VDSISLGGLVEKLKGRLFTFGCSFTNYRWSTWADILGAEFNEFQNWGQSGGGNQFIFNSVMEADQRHRFSHGDTVVVCWTGTQRDDRYVDHRWHTLGNVFNCPIYDPKYLREYVEERGYLIRDLACMKAVKVLLESIPGLTWRFLSMIEPNNVDDTRDVTQLYQDVVDSIAPSYYTVLFKEIGWPDRNGDPHPTPSEHLAYLDAVLPGWVTKEEIRAKIAHETVNLDRGRSGLSRVERL